MTKRTESNVGMEKAGKTRLPKDMGPGKDNRKFTWEFLRHLFYTQGRTLEMATPNDLYMALACTVRNQLLERWLHTVENYPKPGVRIVSYLSAEFLLGPHLENNLVNLGIYDEAREALEELGLDLRKMIKQEEEPGLGNGGLGRLAACYLDSLATLEVPASATGSAMNSAFSTRKSGMAGKWRSPINGWMGNPWEICRPEIAYHVKWAGHTESYHDDQGCHRVRWIPGRVVKGMAYDTPIAGYRVNTCNPLRLWKAEAVESFDFADFNVGDYYGAVRKRSSRRPSPRCSIPMTSPRWENASGWRSNTSSSPARFRI